jgi:hypothetical protein
MSLQLLLAEIRETHRMHQDLLRAELRLGQQIAAIERRIERANEGLIPSERSAAHSDREAEEVVLPNRSLPRVKQEGRGLRRTVTQLTPASTFPQSSSDKGSADAGAPIDLQGHSTPVDQNMIAEQIPTQAPCVAPDLTDAQWNSGDAGASIGDGDQGQSGDLGNVVSAATLPLQEAAAGIRKHQLALRRRMEKLAKQLPVTPFIESICGFGWFGAAQIVGETGDLAAYANPAKVWKRMGLAVIDGRSQRRVAGAAALDHGYAPHRRTIMHVIGESLIKKQNVYRELYVARKEYETTKAPDLTKMQWHRRAMRYAEKRLLRDLWRAWRDATLDSGTTTPAS